MKVKVKKMFNGKVSLRSHVVKDCIRENEPVEVEYGGETMYLSPDDLAVKAFHSGIKIRSKWGNKIYELIDFDWCPNQPKLL